MSRTDDRESTRITRDDLESRFRQTIGEVEQTTEKARNVGIAAAAGLVVLLILLAFLGGKKSGRRGTTVVEVRRI